METNIPVMGAWASGLILNTVLASTKVRLVPPGSLETAHGTQCWGGQPRPLAMRSCTPQCLCPDAFITKCSLSTCVPQLGAQHSQGWRGWIQLLNSFLSDFWPTTLWCHIPPISCWTEDFSRGLDSPHLALKSLKNKTPCSQSYPRNFWLFLTLTGFSMTALWASSFLIESSLCFLGKPQSLAFMAENSRGRTW